MINVESCRAEYLKKDVFPHIGKRTITDIKSKDILSVLRKMEQSIMTNIWYTVPTLCRYPVRKKHYCWNYRKLLTDIVWS